MISIVKAYKFIHEELLPRGDNIHSGKVGYFALKVSKGLKYFDSFLPVSLVTKCLD